MEDNQSQIENKSLFDNYQNDVQYIPVQKVVVDKCDPDFFLKNLKQAYPLYKNPRGLCLIINIYQIDNMPPRRWSERDTDALKQLFEEFMFETRIYTDSTHDLTAKHLKQIIKDFSKAKEHEEAQCCVVCLMSHGEEGCLTSKEGDKVLLDDIFNMFNNINCPYLAGKPKLFFIQSCRDDPVAGPAEDFGIRLSLSSNDLLDNVKIESNNNYDETDGGGTGAGECNNQCQTYHMPSLCDMLIGFPTQKGFIAYRKPEIGSWYMNAIVQIFSKYAKNTDLCAMLNMVNALISNEVTNMGRKQMSEYTSKFTKPYFFFYPGFYLNQEAIKAANSKKSLKHIQLNDSPQLMPPIKMVKLSHEAVARYKTRNIEENICLIAKRKLSTTNNYNTRKANYVELVNNQNSEQHDSNSCFIKSYKDIITQDNVMYISSSKASNHWKAIAREMDINECKINEIDCEINDSSKKLYQIINLWINNVGYTKATYTKLFEILSLCKLNSIKEDIAFYMQQTSNDTIIDEILN